MVENKDVAIIDIEKYNALRDFKDNILKGKFIKVFNKFSRNEYYQFTERDEVINQYEKSNSELVEENKKLVEKYDELSRNFNERVKEEKNKFLEDFSNKSIFQFIRWRKEFNIWKKK